MKKVISILLLSIVIITGIKTAQAQVWTPVGAGLPGNWKFDEISLKTASANGLVYAAYSHIPFSGSSSILVKSWDGLSWTTYPPVPSTSFYISDIAVDGQNIYLTGRSNGNTIAFYEFNGSTWSAKAPAGFSGRTLTAKMINGDLVVAGAFSATGFSDLFSYDGNNFLAFPTLPVAFNDVRDIHLFNGELYISGDAGFGGTSPTGLLKLSGGSLWTQPAHFYQGTSTSSNGFKMFTYQNTLYMADISFYNILSLGTDTLHLEGALNHSLSDFAEFNGDAYLVGDTASSTAQTNRITKFDGTAFTALFGGPSAVSAAEVQNSELYVFSLTSVLLNGITYNHAFRTQANFSLITGETYNDINNDCFRNSNEVNIPNVFIDLSGNVVSSSGLGQFSFGLSPGTYSVDTVYIPNAIGKNTTNNCPLPTSISLGTGQSVSHNIPLSNNIPTDMQVLIQAYRGWSARFGFDENYKINVNNTGNTTQSSVTLKVEVPPTLTVVSSTPAPTSAAGNVLTYNFLNIQPLKGESINLQVNVDTSANALGDTLIWFTHLDPIAGDADLSDNRDTLVQRVVGAYDPNDKQVSHSQIRPGTKNVDYHIRFQNTGNDVAYKVTVVDTLDMTLPITHIVINSASHPYSLSVVNNILIWEFDNIMLPDSGADYAGSQGYVSFTAGLNPTLAVGDTVENDAEIYFDYQKPVHTNKAKTAIVNNISLPHHKKQFLVDVFPNPAKDKLNVANNEAEVMEFQLINTAGVVVREVIVRPYTKTSISIGQLSPGLYLLKGSNITYKVILE